MLGMSMSLSRFYVTNGSIAPLYGGGTDFRSGRITEMGGNPLLSQPWRLRLAVSRADDFRFTPNIGHALAMFSNCGLSDKGSFSVSHRAHGSLRGRRQVMARPMMASGTGCLYMSVARSLMNLAWPQHHSRDHPASVPMGHGSVPEERVQVFLYGHAGISSLVQAK